QGAGEIVPVVVSGWLPRKACNAVAGAAADVFIGIGRRLAAAGQSIADHREVGRQDASDVEVVDGGEQFAPGEVPVAAKDDQDARLRQKRLVGALTQTIVLADRLRRDRHRYASLRWVIWGLWLFRHPIPLAIRHPANTQNLM